MILGLVAWFLYKPSALEVIGFINQEHGRFITNSWLFGVFLTAVFAIGIGLGLPGGSVIVLMAGYVFGMNLGFLISLSGILIGALVTLVMVRFAGWRIDRHLKSAAWINAQPFLFLFLLRNIPILPFSMVSILGSTMRLSVFNYLLATAIGSIPSVGLIVIIGARVADHFDKPKMPTLTDVLSDPVLLVPAAALILLTLIAWAVRGYFLRRD